MTAQTVDKPSARRAKIEGNDVAEWSAPQKQVAFPDASLSEKVPQGRPASVSGVHRPALGESDLRKLETTPPKTLYDPHAETAMGSKSAHRERYVPDFPASGREAARSHRLSASPTIRVSIGRIDVRAQVTEQVTPKPPAPKPSRYRPPLTLDDYLKKRSGGT